MKTTRYTEQFKEQALSKFHARSTQQSVQDIANELNTPLGTLKNWIKQSAKGKAQTPTTDTGAASWDASQRLAALAQSYPLKDQDLHAWCREKGIFAHQLRQWESDFCQSEKHNSSASDSALRQAKQKCEQLERQLRRKEKALAEAAALLVLQKKFQALWEAEEK